MKKTYKIPVVWSKKVYEVAVSWTETGIVLIEADNLEAAIEKAEETIRKTFSGSKLVSPT